jgi:hypothetical protein
MSEERVVAKADRLQPAITWTTALGQAASNTAGRVGTWAVSTAQRAGSVVAVLLGPAVLSVYAFAVWSLTANMGWTDSFPFTSGPLSSWIIWTGLAVALHGASLILRRQKDRP